MPGLRSGPPLQRWPALARQLKPMSDLPTRTESEDLLAPATKPPPPRCRRAPRPGARRDRQSRRAPARRRAPTRRQRSRAGRRPPRRRRRAAALGPDENREGGRGDHGLAPEGTPGRPRRRAKGRRGTLGRNGQTGDGPAEPPKAAGLSGPGRFSSVGAPQIARQTLKQERATPPTTAVAPLARQDHMPVRPPIPLRTHGTNATQDCRGDSRRRHPPEPAGDRRSDGRSH